MCVSSTLSGGDVEPLHELKCEAETHKEWGAMIFACIVVNLCTLIGLLTFVPGIKGLMENEATRAAWLSGSSSFAAGALLAAAAFLMIPECTPARPPSLRRVHRSALPRLPAVAAHAFKFRRLPPINIRSTLLTKTPRAAVHMVSSKKNDPVLEEGEAAARVGIMLLLGFAIGLIIDTAVSAIKSDGPAGAGHVVKDEETPAIDKADESVVAVNLQFRTATSIFVGDFMHNLGDGFSIGAAFKVCGTSMGWTVAWGAFVSSGHPLAMPVSPFRPSPPLSHTVCQIHCHCRFCTANLIWRG
jgi:zinc transporter ZupT